MAPRAPGGLSCMNLALCAAYVPCHAFPNNFSKCWLTRHSCLFPSAANKHCNIAVCSNRDVQECLIREASLHLNFEAAFAFLGLRITSRQGELIKSFLGPYSARPGSSVIDDAQVPASATTPDLTIHGCLRRSEGSSSGAWRLRQPPALFWLVAHTQCCLGASSPTLVSF